MGDAISVPSMAASERIVWGVYDEAHVHGDSVYAMTCSGDACDMHAVSHHVGTWLDVRRPIQGSQLGSTHIETIREDKSTRDGVAITKTIISNEAYT